MKRRKFILINRKGELLVFWQTKKGIYLLDQYGEIMTEEVSLFLARLTRSLDTEKLIYIGDL